MPDVSDFKAGLFACNTCAQVIFIDSATLWGSNRFRMDGPDQIYVDHCGGCDHWRHYFRIAGMINGVR